MAIAEQTTSGAAINTGKVAGRRAVRYNSLDELLADAERLARSPHRTLGNWSLGAICKHIASALTMAMDGNVPPAPWILRFIGARFMKARMLRGPMPAGYKLPKAAAKVLLPEKTSDEDGVTALRAALARWKKEPQRHPHPFFGPLSPAEWEQLQLRHSEMHMSFVLPQ